MNRAIANLTDTRIRSVTPLPSPAQLKYDLRIGDKSKATVNTGRQRITQVIHGGDSKFLLVLGPCSVHSVSECLEYTHWLKNMNDQYGSKILFVMRLCFAKPRTSPAWRGFWSDPDLNGQCDVAKGWRAARQLALEITHLGIPIAGEYIDVTGQQTVDDLYSMYWLGAREVANQELRCVMSGVSCPAGIKNPISGPITPAIDALRFARASHKLSAIADHGGPALFETTGNPDTFLILRGTSSGPNYCAGSVREVASQLCVANLESRIMIDLSHGNSRKNHSEQQNVCRAVVAQIREGQDRCPIFGALYESYIRDGAQKCESDEYGNVTPLRGISITDECDGLERSQRLIDELYHELPN